MPPQMQHPCGSCGYFWADVAVLLLVLVAVLAPIALLGWWALRK